MITVFTIDISDKKNIDEVRESLNFLSTICRVKLSDSQIEELLTGKLVMSLDEFILLFQVYSAWYDKSIIKIWIKQNIDEYLYTFKNKEYQIIP